MALALMVVASEDVPEYIKDVILLHVSGIALLTLIINATTTGAVVNYLKLTEYSALKRNLLISVSL
jgi:hypothetical protein